MFILIIYLCMKRIKQFLFLFVNIFFSCSKEDFISDEISRVDEISKDGSRNGSKVISYDEFLLLADESYQNDSVYLKYLNNKKDFNDQPQLRSSGATIVELTATGYTSSKVRDGMENQTAMFPTAQYGLSAFITYFIDYYEVEMKILLPTNALVAYELLSPNCGYHPGISGQRGYISFRDGDYWVMRTNLSYVKYDNLGRSINMWLPVTRNALEWKYGILVN